MAKYTKYEALKLTMFWSLVIAIILFVIDSICAIAGVAQVGIIIIFVLAVLATALSAGVWLYIKIKKTNRKLTQ
ncbi:hypothetical protein D8X55_04865 [Malacoplasma penetrans]|nr:hypothetical protein [Malacoplasma penetrans]RXY96052.1 hypothetical protein D8X55_04865 [Malacoplasma penetrans]